MNRQFNNDLLVFFGMLFAFCVVSAIANRPGSYTTWAIIFGIVLAFLIKARR